MGRILVVEDEKDTCNLIVRWLRSWGHDVAHAYTGEAALEPAAAQSFDLALVDIRLPGIDGFEVIRRLARDLESPPTVVVSITDSGDVPGDVELGGWVSKPCRKERLRHAIDNALARGD